MLDDLEMQSRFGGVTQEVGGVPGFERHPCDFLYIVLASDLHQCPKNTFGHLNPVTPRQISRTSSSSPKGFPKNAAPSRSKNIPSAGIKTPIHPKPPAAISI